MLKKAGIVAAAAVTLSLVAAPAFAATSAVTPQDDPTSTLPYSPSDVPSFGDAYNTFIFGGGALGTGAAALVAGAYTGIFTTPMLVERSLEHHNG